MTTDTLSIERALNPTMHDFERLRTGNTDPSGMLTVAGRSLGQVHTILRRELPPGRIAIYEAGGGSVSYIPDDIRARANLTVVDIDPVQVQNNEYAATVVQGDIQTYRVAEPSFDLVVCYNVIEHIPNVEAAFDGFMAALKPGGLLFIAAPNPYSLSGVVTKYTPHWFHVFFCKYILGWKTAGQPGQPPFPTCYHELVDPDKFVAHAEAHGFTTLHQCVYESPRYPELRASRPVFAAMLDTGAVTLNALMLNRTDVRRGDYHLIFRRDR